MQEQADTLHGNEAVSALVLNAKAANRIGGTKEKPVEIRLRERGAKKVHIFKGWKELILYPNRPIERCIALYNDTPLPWWDSDMPYYERKMVKMAARLCVSRRQYKKGAIVRFKNGKKTLLKVKFEHLYTAKP